MAAPCFWVFGPPDAAVLALVESGETLSEILSTYYASKLGSSSSSSSSNSSSSSDSSGNAKRAVLGSLALLAAGLAYRQFSGGGNRGEDRGGGAPPPSAAAAAPTPAPAHKKKVSQHPQRERERERERESVVTHATASSALHDVRPDSAALTHLHDEEVQEAVREAQAAKMLEKRGSKT